MSAGGLTRLVRAGDEAAGGQFFRYLLIGGTGYVLALCCFSVLTAIGVVPYRAIVLVFVLNGAFNFTLFRRWAFPRSTRTVGSETLRFVVVAALSLVVNYAIFATLHSIMGVSSLTAQALAIVGATPVGFAGNRAWSFRRDITSEPVPSDTSQ